MVSQVKSFPETEKILRISCAKLYTKIGSWLVRFYQIIATILISLLLKGIVHLGSPCKHFFNEMFFHEYFL